ncbi:response regulator [Candidatus Saganbacteria bacterium]|nr:response regulator [Candidatus Saganbacteria bacterium]
MDSIKIAVIDDEEGVRESFKMILKIKDYDVETFETGEVAVDGIQKDAFDLAFVDYKLPGIDGIEVLRRLKQKDPNLEVVIVTAYASEQSHANAITLGALEYLRKPFLMEEIYELVERALRKRRAKSIQKKGGNLGPVH